MSLTSEDKKIICSFDGLILEKLGFSNITNKGIQQSCPIHEGDNPLAFSYDRAKCCWSCFTHGCHNKHGNDILGLIKAVKKCSFKEAVDWARSVIDDPQISAGYVPSERNIENKQSNDPIDEKNLDKLIQNFSSIEDRGFERNTLEHFQCGVTDKSSKMYHHRLMIPIRNKDGLLIGFTGRSIYKKCESSGAYHPDWFKLDPKFAGLFSKWRHYPKGLNKSVELYNLHEACNYIKRVGFAVVVEGPFDLWRMWEFGVKNCVASYGCSISAKQVDTLKSITNCIAICFDSDEAGENGYLKAKSAFSTNLKIEKIVLPFDKDPGSLSKQDYNDAIKPQLTILRRRYDTQDNNLNW